MAFLGLSESLTVGRPFAAVALQTRLNGANPSLSARLRKSLVSMVPHPKQNKQGPIVNELDHVFYKPIDRHEDNQILMAIFIHRDEMIALALNLHSETFAILTLSVIDYLFDRSWLVFKCVRIKRQVNTTN